MKVFTYATNSDHDGVVNFRLSARLHGIEPIILGVGVKYEGHLCKFKTMQRVLQELNNDEIILFADAYDVVFAAGESSIKARYFRLDCPHILVGAETACNPNQELKSKYPLCNDPYPYLNSGCYIGKVWALKIMFSDMNLFNLPNSINDQDIMTHYYLSNTGLIVLDTKAVLFQNLFGADAHINYTNGQNVLTEEYPVLFHGNGGVNMSKAVEFAFHER